MIPTPDRSLRFDGFGLDCRNGRLTSGGVEIPLRPKSFDVLCLLVANAGRVVGKDEIFQAVWPNVIVGDDSLVQCIGEIRHALGDHEQTIIRTVPKRGYEFTRGIQGAEPAPTAAPVLASAQQAPAEALHAGARHTRAISVAVALASIIAAIIAWQGAQMLHPAWSSKSPSVSSDAAAIPLSIVVLPLVNVNGDAAQEYFAEGLTEDLTTDLSRIPSSFVIARSSAYAYQGRNIDSRQVGRDLGVRYILEGSVQKLGDSVRLNMRLIEAESRREIWAERFDGARSDLAALQNQVTGTIARTLHLELMQAESARVQRGSPANIDAEDLAMQAFSLIERRTPESVAAARTLLQRSVAMDPTSPASLSLLSDTYTTDLVNRWMFLRDGSRAQWLRAAEDAARSAFALDPNNLYAVGAWATVLQLRGKQEEALSMLKRQVQLNRNYAPAWHRLSYAYVALGRPEEGLAAAREAIRLSPRDGRLYSIYTIMAAAELHQGHDQEALELARKAVESRPDFGVAHSWLAAAAANLGKLDEARAALADFRRLQPDYTIATFRAEHISDNPAFIKQHERYYAGLAAAGLPQ